MSGSISSTEVLSSVTTSQAWSGTANASASRQLVNGVEVRRNDVLDPLFTNANAWYRNPSATYDFTGPGSVKMTTTAALAVGSLLTYTTSGLAPGVSGVYKAASYLVTNTGTAAQTIYANIRAYGTSASTDGPTSADLTIAPGQSALLVVPAVLPTAANEQGYRALVRNRVAMAAGQSLVFAQAIGETVASDAAAPGTYFDGAMPSSTVERRASSRPIQVVGYESSRQSANVFHEVIGRSYPDVTLRPAGLRTGTFSFLFDNEVDAAECERMHSTTAVLTLDDPEVPTAATRYVADGQISRRLDSESMVLWVVSVAYQEVVA